VLPPSNPTPDPGSFRDPAGRVYHAPHGVVRSVSPTAARRFDRVLATGVVDDLITRGLLVATRKVPASVLGEHAGAAAYALEHERVPYVSYPYEWSFEGLRAAALRHLELHRRCLDAGVTLSDASAFNMQFVDTEPLFVDALSLVPYVEGAPWAGHRQFCEQFLNPLLLRAWFGVPHHAASRGGLGAIATAEIAALGRLRHRLSIAALAHVFLPAWMDRRVARRGASALQKAAAARLPRSRFVAILRQLEGWIEGLAPRDAAASVWTDYAEAGVYAATDLEQKRAFVGDAIGALRPALAFDVGCNAGDYAALALTAGAARVVGFEADPRVLERAFRRAAGERLRFLPLYGDAANPSPSQGWRAIERAGTAERGGADMVLALAFVHHLAIGRNIPLGECADWLVATAPHGVVEFVEKTDPTVRRMLALRDDSFPDYALATFRAVLARRARIVREARLPNGRTLLRYVRHATAR
jgi:ribosomal protein L11 methylase PrmA